MVLKKIKEKLNKPEVATAESWQEWMEHAKKEHPFLYFISEILPCNYRIVRNRIKDVYWFFQHRLNPRHRYNTIYTSLKPGYYDPETQILYGCMDTFKNFMETCADKIDWEGSGESHAKAYKEMEEIYDWWVNRRPKREDFLPELPTLPEEWGILPMLNSKYENHPLMKEWKRIAEIHREKEVEFEKEDDDMLIRLIKIRGYIWC